MRKMFKEALMIGSLVIAAVCTAGVGDARAQNCSYWTVWTEAWRLQPGVLAAVGQTTLHEAGGNATVCATQNQVRAEIFFWGATGQQCYSYSPSNPTYGGACTKQTRGTAQAGVQFNCTNAGGPWSAQTNHWAISDASGQTWGPGPSGDGVECGSEGEPACDENHPDFPLCGETPIIIPTNNQQNYPLTSVAGGVVFDIDADGTPETVSWTAAGADLAFLALDRNGNEKIDNGSELIGGRTVAGVSNGWVALRQLLLETGAPTKKAMVDAEDTLYPRLLLWTDRNHNGISEPEELQPASNYLSAIGLGYFDQERRDEHGNRLRYRGWVEIKEAPGQGKSQSAREHQRRLRQAYDVILNVQR